MRVVEDWEGRKKRPRDFEFVELLDFPAVPGERAGGAAERFEAYSAQARSVEDAAEETCAELCRGTLDRVVRWVRGGGHGGASQDVKDYDAPMRVALVEAGLYDAKREWLSRGLRAALRRGAAGRRDAQRSEAEAEAEAPARLAVLEASGGENAVREALAALECAADAVRRSTKSRRRAPLVVLLIKDAERLEKSALADVLLCLADARVEHARDDVRVALVLIGCAGWRLPTSFASRVLATVAVQSTALPGAARFLERFLWRLLARGDLGVVVSGESLDRWLDDFEGADQCFGSVLSRVRLLIFHHFQRRGTEFAHTAERFSSEVAGVALALALDTTGVYEFGARSSRSGEVESTLASSRASTLASAENALFVCRALQPLLTRWATSALHRDKLLAFRLVSRLAGAPRTAATATTTATTSLHKTTTRREDDAQRLYAKLECHLASLAPAELRSTLQNWRDAARQCLGSRVLLLGEIDRDELAAADDVVSVRVLSRGVCAKSAELAAIASELDDTALSGERGATLKAEAAGLFRSVASAVGRALGSPTVSNAALSLRKLLVAHEPAALKPFRRDHTARTLDVLSRKQRTGGADPRCAAFQSACDHLSVDLPKWFGTTVDRLRCDDDRDDRDHHEHDHDHERPPLAQDLDADQQAARFGAAIRDLSYTGLVRDHSKRGRFMVCAT